MNLFDDEEPIDDFLDEEDDLEDDFEEYPLEFEDDEQDDYDSTLDDDTITDEYDEDYLIEEGFFIEGADDSALKDEEDTFDIFNYIDE